jgi:hypothetical protein
MVKEPPTEEQKKNSSVSDEKEDDRSKEEKEADAKKAAAAPAKDAAAAPAKEDAAAAPAKEAAAVQLEDNESGLEVMANGTAETFPLRGHPKSVPATWARGTVDMVDPDGKVADIKREMPNNPDKSRAAWAETRKTSRELAAEQHHQEMQWNRENDAAVAKYKKETFDKIFHNEIVRDEGMKAFYVDPTTYNTVPGVAKGFGEQDKPDKKSDDKDGGDKAEDKANIMLNDDGKALAPGQADKSFQKNEPIERGVAAEQ